MVKNELISIIIPTHNRAALLQRAIDSSLSQTYENIEALVVADGSRDNTEENVQSVNDPRLRYFPESVTLHSDFVHQGHRRLFFTTQFL